MCEIHEAGVELFGISVVHVTPAILAISAVVFLALSLAFMRVDGTGGGR